MAEQLGICLWDEASLPPPTVEDHGSHTQPCHSHKNTICLLYYGPAKRQHTDVSEINYLKLNTIKNTKVNWGKGLNYIHLSLPEIGVNSQLRKILPFLKFLLYHMCAPRSPFPNFRTDILDLQFPTSQQIPCQPRAETEIYSISTHVHIHTSLGPSEKWPGSN